MDSTRIFGDPQRLLADRAWLVRLAFELLGDRDEAEDVAQEAQLRALSADVARGRERSWLARVVRNLSLRWRARREWRAGWERGAAPPPPPGSVHDLAARVEMQRAVAEAVLALDERDRAVILRRFFQDQKPAQIARELGVPVETVRTRTKRALVRLRARLDARHGGREAWSTALLPWAGAGSLGAGTKVAAAAAVVAIAAIVVAPRLSPSGARLAERASPPSRASDLESGAKTSGIDAARPAAAIASARASELAVSGGIVRVVDGQQRAIEGARLWSGTRDRAEEIATSDASGVARLPSSVGATWLTVVADGFRTAERDLPAPRPTEMTLVLSQGASLAGTVVAADSSGSCRDLRVLAIPASRPFGPDHAAALLAGRVPGPVTTSGPNGEFAIGGLDPDASYTLVAGGRGCVSRRLETFTTGRGSAVVTVGFLYGVDLELRQRGGAPLPDRGWLGPPIANDGKCDDTVDDPFRPLVAGLRPTSTRGDRRRYRILHVVDSAEFERVGPFAHAVAEAGFEPKTAEVYLPRVADAPPVEPIELDPLPGLELGSLFVEIRGVEAQVAASAAGGTLGTLTIEPFFLDNRVWELPLEAGQGARRRFEGVPCCSGQWTWWPPSRTARSSFRTERFQRQDGALSGRFQFKDGAATIRVDLSRYGDVEFEVRERDGSLRRDELTLFIQRALTSGDAKPSPSEAFDIQLSAPGPVDFSDAPFVLRVLPPGRYAARPWGTTSARRNVPAQDSRTVPESVDFEIRAGEVAHCSLTLDE